MLFFTASLIHGHRCLVEEVDAVLLLKATHETGDLTNDVFPVLVKAWCWAGPGYSIPSFGPNLLNNLGHSSLRTLK